MYIQTFHDEKRLELSEFLEKEKWKKSEADFSDFKSDFEPVDLLHQLFFEDRSTVANGAVRVGDTAFSVTYSTQQFLVLLCQYCSLGSSLPSVSFELGLKTAEIVKFYNSRICQLVLGVGAISVSGLKTITIRNLALARRSLELVIVVIPSVFKHFQDVNNNEASKQQDSLSRQFEQAVGHLVNHVQELDEKILSVVETILQQHLANWSYTVKGGQTHQIPSANFKALCKQLAKLHESVADIWPPDDIRKLMVNVHQRFMGSVKLEVKSRRLNRSEVGLNEKQKNDLLSEARAFKSELTFYAQSLLRLNVIPDSMLSQEHLDEFWSN